MSVESLSIYLMREKYLITTMRSVVIAGALRLQNAGFLRGLTNEMQVLQFRPGNNR
jgi:hypothetical protein